MGTDQVPLKLGQRVYWRNYAGVLYGGVVKDGPCKKGDRRLARFNIRQSGTQYYLITWGPDPGIWIDARALKTLPALSGVNSKL